MIPVGALVALWTMEAVPVVPLSPLPADPIALPETVQSRPAHPYLRTAFEEFLIIGVGSLWYWRHPAKSSWDLHFDWNDWRAKMFGTRMIVFDDDLFATNGAGPPVRGGDLLSGRARQRSVAAGLVRRVVSHLDRLGVSRRVGRKAVDQ